MNLFSLPLSTTLMALASVETLKSLLDESADVITKRIVSEATLLKAVDELAFNLLYNECVDVPEDQKRILRKFKADFINLANTNKSSAEKKRILSRRGEKFLPALLGIMVPFIENEGENGEHCVNQNAMEDNPPEKLVKKRKRCRLCGRRKDKKAHYVCSNCKSGVCGNHIAEVVGTCCKTECHE